MKKESNTSGITLISLVITIIVMLIIAGISVTAGLDSVRNTKKTAFITELEIIQEKVNTIYEKRKLNKEDIAYYNSLGQDVSVVDESKLTEVLNGISQEGYRYFSKEDLSQLDLSDIAQDVIINFDTRDVRSITGIEIDGTIYYCLTDIPGYTGQKIEYTNKNTLAPTFDVEVTELSNSWQFTINNIVYNSNVEGCTISYKLHNNENWIIVGETNYFEVKNPRII